MSVFSQLDDTELAQLIEALQRDRLALPISRFSLSRYISEVNLEAITAELQRLIQQNWKTSTLLYLLEAIATERDRAITLERTAELVWTHPDFYPCTENRANIAKNDLVRTYKKAESTERSRSAVFSLDESVLTQSAYAITSHDRITITFVSFSRACFGN